MQNECNCDPLGFGGHDENCPRAGKSEGIPTRPTPQPVAGLEEALDPEWHYIDLFRLEQEGGTNAARARRVAKYVAHEIAQALTSPAPDVTDALVEAVNVLAQAEAHCRNCHDYYGGGHNKTSRACDKMRKAVDRLRQLLTDNQAALAAQSKPEPQPALTDAQSVPEAIEECARVAERYPTNDMRDGMVAKGCAKAIRALAAQDGSA